MFPAHPGDELLVVPDIVGLAEPVGSQDQQDAVASKFFHDHPHIGTKVNAQMGLIKRDFMPMKAVIQSQGDLSMDAEKYLLQFFMGVFAPMGMQVVQFVNIIDTSDGKGDIPQPFSN
jgi:hypothetical protein